MSPEHRWALGFELLLLVGLVIAWRRERKEDAPDRAVLDGLRKQNPRLTQRDWMGLGRAAKLAVLRRVRGAKRVG